MKRLLSFLLLAAVLSGCCYTRVCNEGGRTVVEVTNSSWRLFGLFPIFSGDPEYPNRDVTLWFCDSLILDVNMMLMDDVLRKNGGGSLANVSSYKTKENMFFLFSLHTLHTSAELVP